MQSFDREKYMHPSKRANHRQFEILGDFDEMEGIDPTLDPDFKIQVQNGKSKPALFDNSNMIFEDLSDQSDNDSFFGDLQFKHDSALKNKQHFGYQKFRVHSLELKQDSISNYQIIESLGKGGFAKVYSAEAINGPFSGKSVAIKVINKVKVIKDPVSRARVKREVEIHWQLSHPNVVHLYNYFEDVEHVYLVMEICSNGDMLSYLKKRNTAPTTESEVRYIVDKLIKGLGYIHSFDIIHRDLKLSNILISQDLQIKLADFGLATRLDSIISEQKTLCGTLNYISPEVAQRKPYRLQSDVWSLGCITYTLFTGRSPFEANGVDATLEKVKRAQYDVPYHLSREAQQLITFMLQVNPERRIKLKDIYKLPFFDVDLPAKPLNVSFLPNPPQPAPRVNSPKLARHQPRKESLKASNSVLEMPQSYNRGYAPRAVPVYVHPKATNSPPLENGLERFTFSTIDLPLTHKEIPGGMVSILKSGWVTLELNSGTYFIAFSPDSQEVLVYLNYQAKPISDALMNSLTPLKSYRVSSLPKKYFDKYKLVSKFVNVVRGSTPKVIYTSSEARCKLMLNTPMPNFKMVYHNGTKISSEPEKDLLSITYLVNGDEYEKLEINTKNKIVLKLPIFLHVEFLHFQHCLATCLRLSKALDDKRMGSHNSSFHSRHIEIPQYVDDRNDTMLHYPESSAGLDFDYRVHTWILNENDSPLLSPQASLRNDRDIELPLPIKNLPSSTGRSQASIHTARSTLVADPIETFPEMRFIKDVGFCLRAIDTKNNQKFRVLFNDGFILDIPHKKGYFLFGDSTTNLMREFPIKQNLPGPLKERLAHFSNFCKLF